MGWQHLVEELAADGTSESVEDKLAELGSGGWEAVTSWAVPGDPHVKRRVASLHPFQETEAV